MSYFSYGAPAGSTDPTQGFVMSYILSQGMSDTPIMSDDGSEYLYTERRIRVRAVLASTLSPAVPNETPSATLARIRHTLETPRLQLFYFHNTALDPSPLCQSPQPGFTTDARYGPVCTRCDLTQIRGSEVLYVELEYVTWVLECVGSQPFISHRWTEQVNIDEDFLTTKIRQGKIVVRGDGGLNPDSLRGIVAPPLDPGFKRIRADYVLQSDGLALQYTFEDREMFLQPPLGATQADGEYSETTAQDGVRWGECRVKLRGPKTGPLSDKASLLQTAIQIVIQKLILGGRGPEGAWVAFGGVRESLWSNEIEVRIKSIIEPAKTSKTKGVAVDLTRFNTIPIGVDAVSQIPGFDPGDRGTAQLLMVANALNDPCLGQSILTTAGQSILKTGPQTFPDTTSLSTNIPATLSTIPLLPDDATAYDSADPTGAYADYRIQTRYLPDDQTVVLSTAKSGASGAAVQLGQGTMSAVVEWQGERYNNWPQAPELYINDPNIVFLRAELNSGQLDVAGDGVTPIYRLSGRNYYGILDRTKVTILAPVPPYIDAGVGSQLNTVPQTVFNPNPGLTNTSGQNVELQASQSPQTPIQ